MTDRTARGGPLVPGAWFDSGFVAVLVSSYSAAVCGLRVCAPLHDVAPPNSRRGVGPGLLRQAKSRTA
jgi:hypothetical protein